MPSPDIPGTSLRSVRPASAVRILSRWRLLLALSLVLGMFSASSWAQFDPFKDAAKGKLPANKSSKKGKTPPKTTKKGSSRTSRHASSSVRPRPRPTPKPTKIVTVPTSKATPRPTPAPITPPTPPPILPVEPPVKPYAGQTYTNPRDKATMIWVPGGTFLMGTDERVAPPQEKPAVAVALSGYWMYKYPVTVAQYRKFCEATGHPMPDAPAWGWDEDFPMVNVSWNDAVAYCEWAGIKLPTEAQWEFAARGPESLLYPWGNKFDPSRLWNSASGRIGPASVLRPENISESPFGIVDMVGNVWQWCQDWYEPDYYRRAAAKNPRNLLRNPQQRDPKGPGLGSERILRGGSWTMRIGGTGSAFQAYRRYAAPPDKGDAESGFRGVFNVGAPTHPAPSPVSLQ